jgi:excisionase family DNA binding protein
MKQRDARRAPGDADLTAPMGVVEELRDAATCSVETAAVILGIGRSTAYEAARDGSLPAIRVSGRILVPVAKLKAMLGLDGAE